MKYFSSILALVASLLIQMVANAEMACSVSQYGITWTFEKPHEVGKFITGDWWVIGPVKIVKVDPAPGPAAAGEERVEVKGIYGQVTFTADGRMRNGSMIFPELEDKTRGSEKGIFDLRKFWYLTKEVEEKGAAADYILQGFDSRDRKGYSAKFSLSFPKELKPGESLCSSISYPKPIKQTYGQEIGLVCNGQSVVQTVAVLTCLDKIPPVDAFRPPYAGTYKPIFEAKNLKWDLLPKLSAPPTTTNSRQRVEGEAPDWKIMERLFERVCIDRIMGNVNENCCNYGREIARLHGIASLMLMLDVPKEKKEKLLLLVVQRGIDFYGLMKSGQYWEPDGGINMGRKWPILFSGMMLGEADFLKSVSSCQIWQEDMDTYYGTAWDGKPAALWQISFHTFPAHGVLSYEEQPAEKRGDNERFVFNYQMVNSCSYPGIALPSLLMKAKAIWNHDAFFDYVDRWMRNDDNLLYFGHETKTWEHNQSGKTGGPNGASYDSFVNAMWKAYRDKVPEQPNGKDNKKWVWIETDTSKGAYGQFVDNPKPTIQK